jgi:hypothetical protein
MAGTSQEAAPRASASDDALQDPPDNDSTMVEGTTAEQEQLRANLEEFERLFGADEDARDQPTTTRRELWSYYLYYNGSQPVDVIAVCRH